MADTEEFVAYMDLVKFEIDEDSAELDDDEASIDVDFTYIDISGYDPSECDLDEYIDGYIDEEEEERVRINPQIFDDFISQKKPLKKQKLFSLFIFLISSAKTSVAMCEFINHFGKFFFRKVRPQSISKHQFTVCALP